MEGDKEIMIKITDRFYIDADSNCYSLKEKTTIQDETSKNHGKEVFKDRGYYVSLESCLDGMMKLVTREFVGKEDINSIKELKEEIKKQTDFIKSLNLNI